MAVVPNTLTLDLAKSLSVAIGLFGLAFAVWIFYATLVLYPNDSNLLLWGFVFYGMLAVLGVCSALLSRLVWQRIAGRTFSTGAIYGLAAAIATLWMPLFLLSPSMVAYFLIAVALLLLHALFGRHRLEVAPSHYVGNSHSD